MQCNWPVTSFLELNLMLALTAVYGRILKRDHSVIWMLYVLLHVLCFPILLFIMLWIIIYAAQCFSSLISSLDKILTVIIQISSRPTGLRFPLDAKQIFSKRRRNNSPCYDRCTSLWIKFLYQVWPFKWKQMIIRFYWLKKIRYRENLLHFSFSSPDGVPNHTVSLWWTTCDWRSIEIQILLSQVDWNSVI